MASVTRLEPGAPSLRDATLAHLEHLAGVLTERSLTASPAAPPRRLPRLQVTYPEGATEDVYAWRCEDGSWWFWWSWAQRIAPCSDVDDAAVIIERVLKSTLAE